MTRRNPCRAAAFYHHYALYDPVPSRTQGECRHDRRPRRIRAGTL